MHVIHSLFGKELELTPSAGSTFPARSSTRRTVNGRGYHPPETNPMLLLRLLGSGLCRRSFLWILYDHEDRLAIACKRLVVGSIVHEIVFAVHFFFSVCGPCRPARHVEVRRRRHCPDSHYYLFCLAVLSFIPYFCLNSLTIFWETSLISQRPFIISFVN